jgi:hypothetical protein
MHCAEPELKSTLKIEQFAVAAHTPAQDAAQKCGFS